METRHQDDGGADYRDAEGAAQTVDGGVEDAWKLGPHCEPDRNVQVREIAELRLLLCHFVHDLFANEFSSWFGVGGKMCSDGKSWCLFVCVVYLGLLFGG